jgi:hypothetical protein
MDQRYRLTTSPDGLGLRCTTAGLTLAGVALLHKGQHGFAPRPTAELRALLGQAYPDLDRDIEGGLEVVAQALNAGDLTKAMIAAVFLRLPPLDPETAERLARAADGLAKAYNPAEDRDAKGRWTVGGLLAAAQRASGVDTRQLAAQLGEPQDKLSTTTFQALLQGVEARLSQADRRRLAQELIGEANAQAIRIQQTPQGKLTPNAVHRALNAVHTARIAQGTTSEDRDHLLPLWFAVYTRGATQYGSGARAMLPPDFSSPEMRGEAMQAAAYSGAEGFANQRGVSTAREIPLEPTKLEATGSKITPVRPYEARVGAAKRKNYRQTLIEGFPEAGTDMEAHHAIPRFVLKIWPNLFTASEIHSLENLRAIPNALAGLIHRRKIHNQEWKSFYATFKGSTPTRQQVLDFATKVDRKYGEFMLPAIRKLLQDLSARLDALHKAFTQAQSRFDVAFD